MGVYFTQKWIENAVKKFLGKEGEELDESDLEKIRYLAFGETFDNDFYIEMSLENPPVPFVCTDGGDEWGFASIQGDKIPRFLEQYKNQKDIQFSAFGFEEEEDGQWEQYVSSDEAEEKWREFAKSISSEHYYETIEDYDKWDEWYQSVCIHAGEDLGAFKGVQVLRIKGLKFQDFKAFGDLHHLDVLELVETVFGSDEEINSLESLKQFCCWLD